MKYNPFTGRGDVVPKDTPYKGLKRFVTSAKRAATIKLALPKK